MNSSREKAPMSITIFVAVIALMMGGALLKNVVERGVNAWVVAQLLVLGLAFGVWFMRKWAVWGFFAAFALISGFQISAGGEPSRDLFMVALPMILIAGACILPHYRKMR